MQKGSSFFVVPLLLKERLGEVVPVEGAEVFHFFAEADIGDRDAVLHGNGYGDAALGGTVELGQDEFVNTGGFFEYLCLLERVLTGGRVYNKDAAVRSAGMFAGDDLPDFVELVHQVAFGVQTPGGINKQNIILIPDGYIHRFPCHGGGIGILSFGVEAGTRAFRPNAELLHGGGPEGVGGGKEDFFALHAGAVGELGDGRGLAHAVDADDQHDLRRVDRHNAARDAENFFQFRRKEGAEFLRGG